jgi:murein L,D-transpeptidase YafK
MSWKRILSAVAVVMLLTAVVLYTPLGRRIVNKLQGEYSVGERLDQYGEIARSRLRPTFKHAEVVYPPHELVLVGLKKEMSLQVYASDGGRVRFIKSYPILASSGNLGPKLREGDGQIPEGIYRVTFLNPNSSYHLSMRLDYPNRFDCEMAKQDGRENLGGDIMIHGRDVSIGCVAVGDEAAEDLFVMAADTGIENIKVILCPCDFRKAKLDSSGLDLPKWSELLYNDITRELKNLPLPE